jgi:hypothetical protein
VFTGGATKEAFSQLATTTNSGGYELFREILCSHVRRWTVCEPGPQYEIRQYIYSEKKPRKPAAKPQTIKPKTTSSPTKPVTLQFKSNIAGQIRHHHFTGKKPLSNWTARIPSSLPITADDTLASSPSASSRRPPKAKATTSMNEFKSKIPKPPSQRDQHQTTGAVSRLVITSQKSAQNNNQDSHRSSQKGKGVDAAPEPTSNKLEVSPLGTIHEFGSSSTWTRKSPPRSPDWFPLISSNRPLQALSSQTSALSLLTHEPRAPALNIDYRISVSYIPSQFRSTLSRLLATSGPITHLSIREFIALSLTAHHTKPNVNSPLTVTPVSPRASIFTVSFFNNPITGLTLPSHDKEDGVASPKDQKTCPFGCLVNGKHQHIAGTGYPPPISLIVVPFTPISALIPLYAHIILTFLPEILRR